MTMKGLEPAVLSALDDILESLQDTAISLCNKKVRLLLSDSKCQKLVKSGGFLLKTLVKETGIKILVEPLCLTGSLERIVEVQEDKGSIIQGLSKVIGLVRDANTSSLGPEYLYKPSDTIDNDYDASCNDVTIHIKASDGNIWDSAREKAKLGSLGRKLGVKISLTNDQQIMIKGSKGATQMCESILNKRKYYESTNDEKVDGDKSSIENDLKITATALALTCNLRD